MFKGVTTIIFLFQENICIRTSSKIHVAIYELSLTFTAIAYLL